MSRPRISVRWLLVLVAIIALGLFIATEFRDGSPPRFVVRGIPARIARLRPGMTRAEAIEILGIGKSWLRGGTGAVYDGGVGNGHFLAETYNVRPTRIVTRTASVRGGPMGPVPFVQSPAFIQLWFHTEIERDPYETARLTGATFASDSTVLARMPADP